MRLLLQLRTPVLAITRRLLASSICFPSCTLNLEPHCNELQDGWSCEIAKYTKQTHENIDELLNMYVFIKKPAQKSVLSMFSQIVCFLSSVFSFSFFLAISPLVDMKFYQLCVFFASVAPNSSAGLHWPTSRWSWWSSTSLSTSLQGSSSSLSDMDGGDDHWP